MKFRQATLLTFLPMVLGSLLVVAVALGGLVEWWARREAAAVLLRSREALADLLADRQALLASEARLAAETAPLRALVAAAPAIDRTAAREAAARLRLLLRSDLLLITDGRGQLLADASDWTPGSDDLAGVPVVAAALARAEATDVWTDRGQAYQVQAQRVASGGAAEAVIVVGHRVDDRLAEAAGRQIGAAVLVRLQGRPIAVAPPELRALLAGGPPPPPPLATAGAAAAGGDGAAPAPAPAPATWQTSAGRYLVLGGAFPGYPNAQVLDALILQRADVALGPALRLRPLLAAGLAVVALLMSFLVLVLTRRLSRPVDRLVRLAGEVAVADADPLSARSRASGEDIEDLESSIRSMVSQLEVAREVRASKERLEEELDVAARIQTAVLPPSDLEVPGFEVAGRMMPAVEVGGDYFDVHPTASGCWLAVGDVAGHGLPAGLVMLMVQSAIGALARQAPTPSVVDALGAVNRVLVDNVRRRLRRDEHVTFTLIEIGRDGRAVFAGAHEEILIWRAATRSCERIQPRGFWLGVRDPMPVVEGRFALGPGDLLVLYTDGLIEATNARGEEFGVERALAELDAAADLPAAGIVERLMAASTRWRIRQKDDATVLVLRYLG